MLKFTTLKPIQIGYGDEQIIIFPRLISVAEENELNQKFTDIADSDELKYQKNFEIARATLGEFSLEMPVRLVKEKGELKRVPLVEGAETATEAFNQFFAERTIANERVVLDAFWLFKSQLAPSSSFLEHSAR